MSLKVEAEVIIDADPCLLAWSRQLFVGCEDGSIKSFDASLKPGASWQAHDVQLFALEAGGDRVFSTSNDGGIRVWSVSGDKLAELSGLGGDVGALRLDDNYLFAGNESGEVVVYEKDKPVAKYIVLEEVKDILVSKPYLMTVRDLDVTVTEIKPDSSKFQFATRHTMEGRAPIRQAGSKLLLASRDGRSLRLHENNMQSKFKLLSEQKVSDMILTSIAVEPSGTVAWSGSWDGHLRRWSIGDSTISAAGDLDLGACVNAVVTSQDTGVAYAAVTGGKIVRVGVAFG